MKTNKIIIAVVLAFTMTVANAQNIFFPTKVGTVQVYEQKNAKGKTEGFTRQTVKEIEGSGSNMIIVYEFESLDKNRKPLSEPVLLKIIIKDDVMILDMNQMFAGQQNDPNMQAVMEITGVPVKIYGNIQPGQSLEDANMTMTINLGFIKMKTEVKMTDGKCLAIEDVTVPVGTFKSFKITQTVTTTVMKKAVKTRVITWYANGVGMVKSETYNDKDQLESSSELVEMK